MEKKLDFGKTVTLAQAAKIILATPMNRYNLGGEPGVGKSSLMALIALRTGYQYSLLP